MELTYAQQPLKKIPMGTTAIDRDTFMEYIDGLKDMVSEISLSLVRMLTRNSMLQRNVGLNARCNPFF